MNPSLYRELKDASSATKGRAWVSGVKDDVHRSWHFTRYSLLLLAFSVVPVVGPIVSFLGQVIDPTRDCVWFIALGLTGPNRSRVASCV